MTEEKLSFLPRACEQIFFCYRAKGLPLKSLCVLGCASVQPGLILHWEKAGKMCTWENIHG